MKLRRLFLGSILALLLLLAIAAALLFYASRSETVLRWGVETFASRLPCRLSLSGLHGAIVEPLRIEHLSCENADYRVEAREILLDWSPWLLGRQQLDISSLRAESLVYRDKQPAADARVLPAHLGLPLSVRVAAIEIGTLKIERDAEALLFSDLHIAYEGDADMHRLTLQKLSTEWGNVQGDATLGTVSPLPLQARLQIDSARIAHWPISVAIDVSGPLQRLAATLEGKAGALAFSAQADLAPFDDEPVKALQVLGDAVDLSAFDARLPATALAFELRAQSRGFDSLSGEILVDNPQPGPVDKKRLPLKTLHSKFSASSAALTLNEAVFDLGAAGEASGLAGYRDGLLQLDVDVKRLDLRQIHGSLRRTRLAGNLRIEGGEQRQRVAAHLREADLTFEGEALIAQNRVHIERLIARTDGAQASVSGQIDLNDSVSFALSGELRRFDPARFGDFPKADINGSLRAQGVLRPQWRAQIDYRLARSRFRGETLGGSGSLAIAPGRVRGAALRLNLGANAIELKGSFGSAGDSLRFDLRAPKLRALDSGIDGSLQAAGTVSGTPSRLALDARFVAERVAYDNYRIERWTGEARLEQGEDPRLALNWQLKNIRRGKLALDKLDLTADGSLSAHRIDLSAQGENVDAKAQLAGGFQRETATWRGQLARFENAGGYAFTLLQPAALELSPDRVRFTATRLRFSETEIEFGDSAYLDGVLTSSGSVGGVRLSRLLAMLDSPPNMDSTLVFGARWSLRAGETLDANLAIARQSGDIVIPGEEPLAMGLTESSLEVRVAANRIDARVAIKGTRLSAQGSAQTVAERRAAGWGIAGNAPLVIDARAEWESIRTLFALFAGDAMTGDGSMVLKLQSKGTVAQPQLAGTLTGDKLKFEQVASGVFLRDGLLRASFGDDGLSVSEFRIRGGEGSFRAKGRFATREGRPQVDLTWSAQKLAVVQHPDLRLTVSGAGSLKADDKRIALAGRLAADRGRVELRAQTAPALGSDVVVAGRKERVSATERALKAELDLALDLGPDFRIAGRGLEARLSGQLRLSSPGDAPLRAIGEIRVAEGDYAAYGRKLDVDEGVFFFSGPVDNPGLLIRALRRNQPVEAGVEVTGTARDPRIRLVSVPEVPDPEKLSWLVLGRAVESGSSQDAQALQSSAMALAAGLGTTQLQRQLAGAVGLDELRVGVSDDVSQGGVVAIGKRVSDKIYVSSEHSLSTATNTLRISYQLSQRWSLRTESGITDAVDLFYTISFD